MPKTDFLYYEETFSGLCYGRKPPGQLKVERLMRSQPAWVTPASAIRKKQKSLVLADWSAIAWSEEKVADVIRALGQLMDKGFPVYVWRDRSITPLLKDQLSDLQSPGIRGSIKPAFPHEIITSLTKLHKLTQEKVQILDDYWMRAILSERQQNSERFLSVRDVKQSSHGFSDSLHVKKLVEVMRQSTPAVKYIIHDDYSVEANEIVAFLHSEFSDVTVTKHFLYADITTSELEELRNNTALFERVQYLTLRDNLDDSDSEYLIVATSELRRLTLYSFNQLFNIKMKPDSLKHLELLNITDSYTTVEQLQTLLADAPNIKILTLRCDIDSDVPTSAAISLQHLESLDLQCRLTGLTADQFYVWLINAAPNLKKLLIKDESNFLCDLARVVASPCMKSLEYIYFYDSVISIVQLQSLLGATPNLESFVLHNCRALSTDLKLKAGSLSRLKTIDLRFSPIHAPQLQAFLAAAPNIEKLNVDRCDVLSGDLMIGVCRLSRLKTLNLIGRPINASQLQILLVAAPNIEKLDINGHDVLSGDLTIGVGCLSRLKTLNLSSRPINTAQLEAFLAAAPNIEELDISHCYFLSGNLTIRAGSLSRLKTLNLSTRPVNTAHLQILLVAAPNIEKLNISHCHDLSGDLTIEASSLSRLKTLNLSTSPINLSQLEALLFAAPSIEELDISECYDLSGDLTIEAGSLSRLKMLDLRSSAINLSQLEAFLAAAPNIKKLNCRGCQLLSGNLSLEASSLNQLEELDLGRSSITAPQLQTLLNAAPNLKILNLRYTQHLVVDEQLNNRLTHISCDRNEDAAANAGVVVEREAVIVDSPHNPSEFKNFTPPAEDGSFEFKGTNRTLNQGMIIEKLSQYFTLTQQHLAIIPIIQGGICNALSYHYIASKPEDWARMIEDVSAWDGQQQTLTPNLTAHFNHLYQAINQYQLGVRHRSEMYLGDNLEAFIRATNMLILNPCTPLILNNPWHAVAIRPIKYSDSWFVYDPNFVNGCREVREAELLQTLRVAIGELVSVESARVDMAPAINNPESFIQAGGLLALSQCDNASAMLEQLNPVGDFSKEALNGLLLRDNRGMPAWIRGLSTPLLKTYTENLLEQFRSKNPLDYKAQLQKSMAGLTPLRLHGVITDLEQLPPSRLQNELIDIIRTMPKPKPNYERALQTWYKYRAEAQTVREYCHECVQPSVVKKRLIELSSTAQVAALQWGLQNYCQNIHRPVFYIHSPDDLICSAPFVARHADNTGRLQKGPGGPLFDFLQAPHEVSNPPILIVNYDQFSADDIVRFNSLLDKARRIDGTEVPEALQVIGLINLNKPDCYQGSDFYSRFDKIETCPIPASQLAQVIPELPLFDKEPHMPGVNCINLYHSSDWEGRLLGRWVLENNTLTFLEGALQGALKKGSSITIQNGPWEDERFLHFWRQALLQGFIRHAGRILHIPSHLQLIREDGYQWYFVKCVAGLTQEASAVVLNPSCLGDFFCRYDINQQSLLNVHGFIEAAKGSTLTVNVTRSLSHDAWAMVLDECKAHQVTLVVHFAPGVELPDYLGKALAADSSIQSAPQVIESTDRDTTVSQLTSTEADWIVIDVSECRPGDLLGHIHGSFNPHTLIFEFNQLDGVVTRALQDGKKIILTGRFSPELADALAPLLLSGQYHNTLRLVTEDATLFNYALVDSFEVTPEDKLSCLGELDAVLEAQLKPLLSFQSLSQLKTHRDFLLANPTTPSNVSWLGLHDLPGGVQLLPAFTTIDSEVRVSAFTHARLNAVNAVLSRAPYVFLTGLSGVGKSTFVEKELCQQGDVLYFGEDNIQQWVEDMSTTGTKFLFLDEANLSSGEWSEFEGLFHNPPYMLMNGSLHQLTAQHKVIFAGNPISYGDERMLAPLFVRHGNAVLFTPLPPEVLYEKILKPVFENTLLQDKATTISAHLLDVYRFLCSKSQTEVLISPRELQMMALLIVSCYQDDSNQDVETMTEWKAYHLAKHLVPQDSRAEFDRQFKPTTELPTRVKPEVGNTSFLITPSRERIWSQLDALLVLRETRRQEEIEGNEAQRYGGLGGIILEGEPGIGKSELVTFALIARGYEERHDFTGKTTKEKGFYRMPVSMSIDEKKNLLLKAFHEGAVVVINEINSSPMMERLLNGLLMGKTPENQRPEHPGFMIIGTQNPMTMAGRRVVSTALARRMITIELPTYTHEELLSILIAKGVEPESAESMVQAYEKQVLYARNKHLNPAPTLRDLLKLVEWENPTDALAATSDNRPVVAGGARFFRENIENRRRNELPVSSTHMLKS